MRKRKEEEEENEHTHNRTKWSTGANGALHTAPASLSGEPNGQLEIPLFYWWYFFLRSGHVHAALLDRHQVIVVLTQQEGHTKASGTCRQPSEKLFCLTGGSQLRAPGSRTPAALGEWGYRWPLV